MLSDELRIMDGEAAAESAEKQRERLHTEEARAEQIREQAQFEASRVLNEASRVAEGLKAQATLESLQRLSRAQASERRLKVSLEKR